MRVNICIVGNSKEIADFLKQVGNRLERNIDVNHLAESLHNALDSTLKSNS